jgi:D-beta-D-heptose 7-phosphate kinase / D-beta-D-heptose 1-phosphate adenosyltransferase
VSPVDRASPLVVVGDALLDVDVVGSADRLAPDAPVPVVKIERETARPGGAGLAAVVARRLSRRAVVLVAPLAGDAEGELLRTLLEEEDVTVVPLPHAGRTAVKRRVLAGGRSLLRVDRPAGPLTVEELPEEAAGVLEVAAAVLVSDYGAGATALEPLRAALQGHRVPVVWDPHPGGATPVPGVTLATPNELELRALGDAPGDADRGRGGEGRLIGLTDLTARAAGLVRRWQTGGVAVTLGARGALLSRGDAPPTLVPPPRLPVDGQDTCGAGDCFSATATLALADGAVVMEAVEAAVATASRFVADGGAGALVPRRDATPPTVQQEAPAADDVRRPAHGSIEAAAEVAERVRARGGTVVATGGCFDLLHAGHVATLEAARSLGDCLVVLLNSDDSVRRLKGPTRPIQADQDRVRVLAALDAVDAVAVFGEDTPVEALRRLRPHMWAKGGDYSIEQMPEAEVMSEWGGQVIVLPYLDGRSTTRLVQYAGSAGG